LHTGKIIDSAASLKLRVGSMSTGYSSDYIIITFQENRIQRSIYRRLSLPPLFLLRHHLHLQIHLLLLTNRDSTKKRNSKNGKRNKIFFTHKRARIIVNTPLFPLLKVLILFNRFLSSKLRFRDHRDYKYNGNHNGNV